MAIAYREQLIVDFRHWHTLPGGDEIMLEAVLDGGEFCYLRIGYMAFAELKRVVASLPKTYDGR
jgi:hypothetical protein